MLNSTLQWLNSVLRHAVCKSENLKAREKRLVAFDLSTTVVLVTSSFRNRKPVGCLCNVRALIRNTRPACSSTDINRCTEKVSSSGYWSLYGSTTSWQHSHWRTWRNNSQCGPQCRWILRKTRWMNAWFLQCYSGLTLRNE